MNNDRAIEVDYHLPRFSKRSLAAFIDLVLLFLLTAILATIFFFTCSAMPYYTAPQEDLVSLKLDSRIGLFVPDDNGNPMLITDKYNESNTSDSTEIKEIYSTALTTFYSESDDLVFHNDDGSPSGDGVYIYNQLKEEAQTSDGHFSLFDSTSATVDLHDPNAFVENDDLLADYLDDFISFYQTNIENALGYLSNASIYSKATRIKTYTWIGATLSSYVISFFVVFMVMPLCLKRGYRTLGMWLGKYGIVYVDGLNPTVSRFLLRFLWRFLLEGLLSWVSLFIPLIVSSFMSYKGMYGQSLPDYLANTYPVDLSSAQIYLTPNEYVRALMDGKAMAGKSFKGTSPEEKESTRRDRQRKNGDD